MTERDETQKLTFFGKVLVDGIERTPHVADSENASKEIVDNYTVFKSKL